MEESGGDEDAVLEVMKTTYKPGETKALYNSMIHNLVKGQGPKDMENLQTLFSWCAYAKESLSIYDLLQIWEVGPSPEKFELEAEIQSRYKRYVQDTLLRKVFFFLEIEGHQGNPLSRRWNLTIVLEYRAFQEFY
jgi:hypothetical protein